MILIGRLIAVKKTDDWMPIFDNTIAKPTPKYSIKAIFTSWGLSKK